MEDLTIEYSIDISNTTLFKESFSFFPGDDPLITYYWEYAVLNNIEYPTIVVKENASRTLTNHTSIPEPDTILFESQSKEILEKQFYGDDLSRARIPGKTYSNKRYPKGGELKEHLSPDPVQFKSQVIDQSTGLGISGVEIKNNPSIANLEGQKVISDPNGFFTIPTKGGLGTTQRLILSVKKYDSKTLSISTLNGSIRSDINIIELIPNTKKLFSSILKAQATSDEQKKKMTEEEKKEFIEQTKEKAIEEIKIRLIPYLIKKLLCEPYGVCDPIGLINKAKAAKEKAKDLNERRKERKAKKEEEKKLKEEEKMKNETLT